MSIDRRNLLKSGVALSIASLATSTANAAKPEAKHSIYLPGAEQLIPENLPKSFSKAEMDRRWAKLRQWMNRAKYDCLLIPARPGGNADVKWVSESNANWVVFPANGTPTLIFRGGDDSRSVADNSPVQFDLRVSRFNRSRVIIDRIKELGMQESRIGVGNLSGQMRNDEGGVSHITMTNLINAFPKAKFESAVQLLMKVKLERSSEEIQVLRLASRISELAIRTLVETAAPGVAQRDVWFQVFKTLLDASGEEPQRLSIRGGGEGNTAGGRPLDEKFIAGQICSQGNGRPVCLVTRRRSIKPFALAHPLPPIWDSAMKYCIEIYEIPEGHLRNPAMSFQEYGELYQKKVEARGSAYWGVVFHTAGASGDGPRMGPNRPDENGDHIPQTGAWCSRSKPRFAIEGVETPSAQFGSPVLITETGAEHLGVRKPQVIYARELI